MLVGNNAGLVSDTVVDILNGCADGRSGAAGEWGGKDDAPEGLPRPGIDSPRGKEPE